MAYKQPSSGSSFKMMGSSPAKKPGIFDYKGNRISTKKAEEMEKNKEPGWEHTKYTEGDAVKKASEEADKSTTAKGKSKWLKEASEQSKTMSDRMTDETEAYGSGKTKGELYTARHKKDAELQKKAEKGTYSKSKADEGKEDNTEGYFKGMGSKSLSHKSTGSGEFPTEGLIKETREGRK